MHIIPCSNIKEVPSSLDNKRERGGGHVRHSACNLIIVSVIPVQLITLRIFILCDEIVELLRKVVIKTVSVCTE